MSYLHDKLVESRRVAAPPLVPQRPPAVNEPANEPPDVALTETECDAMDETMLEAA